MCIPILSLEFGLTHKDVHWPAIHWYLLTKQPVGASEDNLIESQQGDGASTSLLRTWKNIDDKIDEL